MEILKNDSNFFESNNLFILAFDDNSILRENLEATSMGYPRVEQEDLKKIL